MKIEVHKQGGTRKVIDIEAGATKGATVGVNVWNQDGTLFVPASGGTPTPGGGYVTYWRFILEIPANIVALAGVTGTGIYVITGAGTSATRTISSSDGSVSITNPAGLAGNIDLSVPVPDTAMPYFIPDGETYTIALYKQGLFTIPIDLGVGSSLVVDGILVEVD